MQQTMTGRGVDAAPAADAASSYALGYAEREFSVRRSPSANSPPFLMGVTPSP
jgi:hypothetical protein